MKPEDCYEHKETDPRKLLALHIKTATKHFNEASKREAALKEVWLELNR